MIIETNALFIGMRQVIERRIFASHSIDGFFYGSLRSVELDLNKQSVVKGDFLDGLHGLKSAEPCIYTTIFDDRTCPLWCIVPRPRRGLDH